MVPEPGREFAAAGEPWRRNLLACWRRRLRRASKRGGLFLLLLSLTAGKVYSQTESLPATVGANRPLYMQAWKAYLEGDYRQALELAKRGYGEDREAGRQAGMAEALNLIGTVYYKQGDYNRALSTYQDALHAAERAHYLFGLGRDWSSLGSTYYRLGKFHEAHHYYMESLRIRERIGDRDEIARGLNDLANVYQQLGDYARALQLRRRALRLWRKVPDPIGVADALNDIAWTYEDMGRNAESLRYLRSLKEYAELHHRWGMADTLESIGRVEGKLGRYNEATRDLQAAYRQFAQLGTRDEMAQTLSDLGDTDLLARKPGAAIIAYQDALGDEVSVNDLSVEGATFVGMMQAWKSWGNPSLAIFYGKQAVNLFQTIRGDVAAFDPSLGRTFLRRKEGAYRQLAGLLVTEGRLPEAEQVLDMLKEEEYFHFIQRDESAANSLSTRATLTAKEAQTDRRYHELSGHLAELGREYGELLRNKTRTPEEEKRLETLQNELGVAANAFQQFLGQLGKEFASEGGQASGRIFQIQELQGLMEDLRELGHGSVVLYTIVGPTSYRVILLTPDVELAREYPIGEAALASKVLAFRQAVQDPRADPRPLAEQLYRVIVGPVAEDLAQAHARTLMWSLDGVLRYLPISALYDGHQYLVERYRNVLFTPASIARLKDTPAAHPTGLGLGVSERYPGFPALPSVPLELHDIIRRPNESAGQPEGVIPGKILLNHAFTETAFKQQLLLGYNVVHIATHFALEPGDDGNSFLLLGDGSHLFLSQIESSFDLFRGVDLLTLSACDTMVGSSEGDGREVEGLGVLAQREGAKAVLATLWPVADRSTAILMRDFYRTLEDHPGTTKAEALREAQLALLEGGSPSSRKVSGRAACASCAPAARGVVPKVEPGEGKPFVPSAAAPFAHPYYWAPFVLIGNWK